MLSQSSATASESIDLILKILQFGSIALLLLLAVQIHRNWARKDGKILTPTFGRVFGLIVIATLAAALTVSAVSSEDKTGAFTLFGTIAGYLAAGAAGRSSGASGGGGGGGSSGGGGGADEPTRAELSESL